VAYVAKIRVHALAGQSVAVPRIERWVVIGMSERRNAVETSRPTSGENARGAELGLALRRPLRQLGQAQPMANI